MLPSHVKSLRDRLAGAHNCQGRYLHGADVSVCLADVPAGTSTSSWLSNLSGRSVLIATRDQVAAALALIELDGTDDKSELYMSVDAIVKGGYAVGTVGLFDSRPRWFSNSDIALLEDLRDMVIRELER